MVLVSSLLKQPRFWLLFWGGLGAAFLLYVIISASVSPKNEKPASALDHDRTLITGEMADFAYAFPPRGAPEYVARVRSSSPLPKRWKSRISRWRT